jgi:hypothetical protein
VYKENSFDDVSRINFRNVLFVKYCLLECDAVLSGRDLLTFGGRFWPSLQGQRVGQASRVSQVRKKLAGQ